MLNKEKAEELIAQYWRDGTVLGSDLANQLQLAINHIEAITPKASVQRRDRPPQHAHRRRPVTGCACPTCVPVDPGTPRPNDAVPQYEHLHGCNCRWCVKK